MLFVFFFFSSRRRHTRYWRDWSSDVCSSDLRTTHRFVSHRLALLGVAMIASLTLACVVGPYLLPYDSLHIDLRARFAPPLTGQHYLGTDPLGRDLAARLLMAGRISLLVGFCAMLLSTLIGTLVEIGRAHV